MLEGKMVKVIFLVDLELLPISFLIIRIPNRFGKLKEKFEIYHRFFNNLYD
jgi:hypothetical protein